MHMKSLKYIYPSFALFGAVALNAQVFQEDFQSYAGNLGSWTGAGTLLDQGGNIVLHLSPGDLQTFDVSAFGAEGTASFDIFDFGDIPNPEGPRWGISDPDQLVAISPSGRAGTSDEFYYSPNGNPSQTGSWFGVTFFGPGGTTGERPVTLESSVGANDGVGAWVSWDFEIASNGSVTVTGLGGTFSRTNTLGTVDDIQQIFFYGDPDTTNGLLVDNITYTAVPEPSAYALAFGAVVGMLIYLRKRQ